MVERTSSIVLLMLLTSMGVATVAVFSLLISIFSIAYAFEVLRFAWLIRLDGSRSEGMRRTVAYAAAELCTRLNEPWRRELLLGALN